MYQGGVTGIVKDFKELEVHGVGKPYRKKLIGQDKGQKGMIEAFLGAIKSGGALPICPEEIFSVTRATLSVLESLQQRAAVLLS